MEIKELRERLVGKTLLYEGSYGPSECIVEFVDENKNDRGGNYLMLCSSKSRPLIIDRRLIEDWLDSGDVMDKPTKYFVIWETTPAVFMGIKG
ncbi:MAG: hypothetical protein LUD72_10060 [Bacteroidales bacterium]|nr:hypothetical protein [Bacteroidales bacterium]